MTLRCFYATSPHLSAQALSRNAFDYTALSYIGQRRVQVIQKEALEKISSTPVLKETQDASLTVSLKELTPHLKRHRSRDKGKEKVSANVQDNAGMTLTRTHSVVTLDDLKEISGVPSHEMVNRHIHKLVQVRHCCLYISFQSSVVFVLMFMSVRCWKRRSISLRSIQPTRRRWLWMEKLLTVQKDEQIQSANQKIKIVAAKAVQAFQLTKEYNTI